MQKRKKPHTLNDTEHNNRVIEINKEICGKIVYKNGRGYFPDITKGNVCYEIELFRKIEHLKNKARKWNKKNKHILIVVISNKSKEIFDEVYLYEKGLIKLK